MKLQLWLDESGDFQDVGKTNRNPSLVGGILIEEGRINKEDARNLLGKSYVHFFEEKSEYTLQILEEIYSRQGKFVIFQNEERLMVIDGDTTYLNVLAEGIIQLLLKLSALHGKFELDICIATRKNVTKGYGIIERDQYTQRLKERVIVGLARKTLTRKNNWKYNIRFDDARTDCHLMLADGVCNTFLTRTSSKFSNEQREQITQLYQGEYIFSFYENTSEKEIQRLLAEGNFSDALFEILTNQYLENHSNYLDLTLNRLKELDDYSVKVHFQEFSIKLNTLIKIDRKYNFTKPILEGIQKELLPKLSENQIMVTEFKLDIILYLYTLYTHEGSVLADQQDKLFLTHINQVDDIMTKMTYINIYKIRKGVHEKNMLNITSSIKDLSHAIKLLEEMIGMMGILEDEVLDTGKDSQKYETLGKAYGTRGQGYMMLIHENSEYLSLAIDDFDKALQHFSTDNDRERQYIYKSFAYSEGKKFKDALTQLFLSCDLSVETTSLESFLKELLSQETSKVIFKYYSYIKIMALAKREKEDELAEQMYQALNCTGINPETIEKRYAFPHPLQFVYWYMALFAEASGKQDLAKRYLKRGIDILEELSMEQITLKVIQLGMLAEKVRMSSNTNELKQSKAQLLNLYREIEKQQNYSIANYLNFLHEKTEQSLTDDNIQNLISMTICIN